MDINRLVEVAEKRMLRGCDADYLVFPTKQDIPKYVR